jgi:phosphoglycerol geranylgeranyltransferase
MIYQSILTLSGKKRMLGLLIDPEETSPEELPGLVQPAASAGVSFMLVGGSLVSRPVTPLLKALRELTTIPTLLFPGSPLQLSDQADGVLLLSLISGRNPEYLIGNHVIAARTIKNSPLEVIPTGYMLIGNGSVSSAGYMSNTMPLPSDKYDLAASTAIAGELLGLRLIYLEGGSGAPAIISPGLISEVKQNIGIPLVVGGGIRTAADLNSVYEAGADIAVIGNVLQKDPSLLGEFASVLE